ncbi:hypothetical protein [Sphingobacterium yanglingense]|uniref:Uncharacterized protein n=1 Tax=Sphingobacterium yanglingense TaxID=1437280 RepID=A0A4R6WH20_9SPHI|nr:hypothetical protein [Sphingobacterium yanglingense]TDQ79480.1 hypothetical protein CLV99_0918 [Sphingobacterium yanglingense]
MNTTKLILVTLLITIGFSAFAQQKRGNKEVYELCFLLPQDMEQLDNKMQILDYPVSKKISLRPKQAKQLISRLKEAQVSSSEIRRCPFDPMYAILIDNKPYALFNAIDCPRVMYPSGGKAVKPIDLKDHNGVQSLVDKIIK